jgi:aminodeoxyfutalosine deaminase
MTETLAAFVRALPKVDLHLHLLGSASLETLAALVAERDELPPGVPRTRVELARLFRFHDFEHFIRVYETVAVLVDRGEAVETVVRGIGRDLAAQGVRYAEVTVTPYSSWLHGIEPDELAEALTRARRQVRRDHAVELRWIYDVPGDCGPRAANETLGFALRIPPEGLLGFGVAGRESGVGRAQFAPMFLRAREAGLRSLPHAGEAAGPRNVWSAIHDLGADRIGHGITSVADAELLDYLRRQRLPLEVSVTSNVATRVVRDLAAHPLPRLVDHGVIVTLCTDDGPMFGTDLCREYLRVHEAFGYTADDLAEFARNGIRSAFCDDGLRGRLLSEVAHVLDAHRLYIQTSG